MSHKRPRPDNPNIAPTPSYRFFFDSRTCREVEETRCLTNRKPYRTRHGRADARIEARRDADGAWRSTIPTIVRKIPHEKE